jgi:hypothetical protein
MDTQTAERIAARFRELLLAEAASGRPLSTLDDIEAASLTLRRKAGEMVAQELAEEAAQEHEDARDVAGDSPPGAGKAECRCGGTARFKGARPRDVVTMGGAVRVWRRYYYCRRCDAGFCPADARLGLGGSGYTGLVQRQAARLCALVPYALAAEMLAELAGVSVSATHAQSLVERVDAAACAFLGEQERVAFADEVAPVGPAPDVLYVEADGVQTPIVGGWRETKVGVCFTKDGQGRRVGKRYVSHLGDAEAFGQMWYAAAAHRGSERAGRVVVLGDGAPWLWHQAQTHFPGATQILDLWHALERLWEVGRAALGAGPGEAQAWVEAQRQRLEAGELGAFLGALRELQAAHPDCAQIGEALTYYTNNRCRMDYRQYREWGLDVGSGSGGHRAPAVPAVERPMARDRQALGRR